MTQSEMLQAPQASVQKRAAAAAAVGSTKQVKPNNAYLPISLNPNGMQALLFASLLYQLPEIVSVFSVRGQIWMSNLLTTSKWYPFIYGVVVFLFGMVQLGESTPMQMTKYLNAVGTLLARFQSQLKFSLDNCHGPVFMLSSTVSKSS